MINSTFDDLSVLKLFARGNLVLQVIPPCKQFHQIWIFFIANECWHQPTLGRQIMGKDKIWAQAKCDRGFCNAVLIYRTVTNIKNPALKPHYDITLITPLLQLFTLCFNYWEPQQLTASQYVHCLISMLMRERCVWRLRSSKDTDIVQ